MIVVIAELAHGDSSIFSYSSCFHSKVALIKVSRKMLIFSHLALLQKEISCSLKDEHSEIFSLEVATTARKLVVACLDVTVEGHWRQLSMRSQGFSATPPHWQCNSYV
ncbi:uncharacterized protein LOC120104163 [Phoenix dactylifera]|uniref:Uncharacterized protein LOC120104163 n=1 Tax=Phoenix dactylifera TaxID=42345 RepID=A0A8B8Z9C6_PHODC|nr:uncharacterized protein LOC120104163 [Phoenix dactylifera]